VYSAFKVFNQFIVTSIMPLEDTQRGLNFNFLRSVITAWQSYEFARWQRHYRNLFEVLKLRITTVVRNCSGCNVMLL
jgi:hypothetical protein